MGRGRPLGPIDGPYPNRLRVLRQAAGLSQEEVARALGVSYVQVGRIERGRTKLSVEHHARLGTVLSVNFDDLFVSGVERLDARLATFARRLSSQQKQQWLDLGEQLVAGSLSSFRRVRRV